MKRSWIYVKSTEYLCYASWGCSCFCHACFIKRKPQILPEESLLWNCRNFTAGGGWIDFACGVKILQSTFSKGRKLGRNKQGQSAGMLVSGCYATLHQAELQTISQKLSSKILKNGTDIEELDKLPTRPWQRRQCIGPSRGNGKTWRGGWFAYCLLWQYLLR